MNLDALRSALRAFAAERDWDQFHSPKNLSMALSVEVAELVEHFQWLTEDESRVLPPATAEQVAEEIADIQIYLVRLADKLGVDIDAAVAAKLELNRARYPADQARGSAAKYTRYEREASGGHDADDGRSDGPGADPKA
jgi:NTP pyrophosphatase (non-canonical NTP hydrolase)